jgi:hypothetical protein
MSVNVTFILEEPTKAQGVLVHKRCNIEITLNPVKTQQLFICNMFRPKGQSNTLIIYIYTYVRVYTYTQAVYMEIISQKLTLCFRVGMHDMGEE